MSKLTNIGYSIVILLQLLVIPLVVLNVFGWLISGVWLLIIGSWWIVLMGIVIYGSSDFLVGILIIPTFGFALVGENAIKKNKRKLTTSIILINMIYTVIAMVIWCILTLIIFSRHLDEKNLIPLLIWVYGVAITPWSALTKDNKASNSVIYVVIISYILFLGLLAFQVSFIQALFIFIIAVLILEFITFTILYLNGQFKVVMSNEDIVPKADQIEEEILKNEALLINADIESDSKNINSELETEKVFSQLLSVDSSKQEDLKSDFGIYMNKTGINNNTQIGILENFIPVGLVFFPNGQYSMSALINDMLATFDFDIAILEIFFPIFAKFNMIDRETLQSQLNQQTDEPIFIKFNKKLLITGVALTCKLGKMVPGTTNSDDFIPLIISDAEVVEVPEGVLM